MIIMPDADMDQTVVDALVGAGYGSLPANAAWPFPSLFPSAKTPPDRLMEQADPPGREPAHWPADSRWR